MGRQDYVDMFEAIGGARELADAGFPAIVAQLTPSRVEHASNGGVHYHFHAPIIVIRDEANNPVVAIGDAAIQAWQRSQERRW